MMTIYEKACHAAREATKEYKVAAEAYRARKIGDTEFLIAHNKMKDAETAFDIAFAKAQAE